MQDNSVAESNNLRGYWKVLYNIKRDAKPFKQNMRCHMLYSYDAIRNYELNKGLEVSLHCHCLLSVDQTLSEMLRCLERDTGEDKRSRSHPQRDICNPIFTAALLTIDTEAT